MLHLGVCAVEAAMRVQTISNVLGGLCLGFIDNAMTASTDNLGAA